MKKLINTLSMVCSVIGAVIGAGFITGREIMTFFYGYNRYVSAIIIFISFFLLIYVILRVQNSHLNYIIKKSKVIILLLNVLIMASMLGATDSLVDLIFGIKKEFPLFSTLMLMISTIICISGYTKLMRVNAIIVPTLLLVFFTAIFVISEKGNLVASSDKIKVRSCFSYAALNVFLVQPFLLKIKEETKTYSPFGVAFISSSVLALAIFVFLGILSKDCVYCDVPLVLLASDNQYLHYLVVGIIFIGIFTTLIAVQYPFYGIIKGNDSFTLIFVSIIAFAVSRIGFYKIVDKIYPAMSVIAIIYYLVFIAICLFFVLKAQRLHTLTLRERKVLRC